MTTLRASAINARVVAAALREAEPQLVRPPGDAKGPIIVDVKPGDIMVRPALFQPRRFSEGLREVDPNHVKDLRTRIERKGELDPILVVKLGWQGYAGPVERWICVDGHHRLEAYKSNKWRGTIKCEWFSGSVQEAMDASLLRNEVAKLPIRHGDRFEEAWRRVLNDMGSKSEIRRLTNVSEGIIAMMRRVRSHYREGTKLGLEFKDKLGKPLDTASWSLARAIWVDLDKRGEWSADEEAAKLARQLRRRMTDKLSRDPKIAAKALWLYSPDTSAELAAELEREVKARTREEQRLPEVGEEAA